MKRKISKNTIDNKNSPRKVTDEYLCMFSWRKKPISKEFLEHLAEQVLKWVTEDEHSYVFQKFYQKMGICERDFHRWLKRDDMDTLRDAYEHALMIIGSRREEGVFTKRFDAGMVRYTQAHYHKNWRDIDAYQTKLREQKEGDGNNKITVVMEKFPSSDKVPEKKDK